MWNIFHQHKTAGNLKTKLATNDCIVKIKCIFNQSMVKYIRFMECYKSGKTYLDF